jgi:NAD(P)-dependent dehydrogenase (short-subunit alcohol dehydrogenase family)
MKRLDQKVALVTGGGTGIGRGVAQMLAEEGARVAICGRRSTPLQAAVEVIVAAGGEAFAFPADVSNPEAVERLVQAVRSRFGPVDILINNAGIFREVEVHKLDQATWDEIMQINLRGPLLLCRAVLPEMRSRRSGHIINISSESGLNFYSGDAAYGVSKHALNDLGEYIQCENQELNIRVNTICPGMVVSEMSENSPDLDPSKCLYPEDIADLVIWLLTRRGNIKIGTPILIQTMENPWQSGKAQ